MAGSGRAMCSHLVLLGIQGTGRAPVWANLEEIDAFGAVIAAEEAWPTQIEIRIESEGFTAPAYIQRCRERETDFALTVEFAAGFRWSEDVWRPDHLVAPATKSEAAGA